MSLVNNTLPTLPIEAALLTLLDVTLHGKRAAVPGKLLGLRTSADIESVVVRGELPFRERFLLVTAVSRDGQSVRVSDGKSSMLASCSERLSREADAVGTVPFPVSLRDRCLFMNGAVRLRAVRRQALLASSPTSWTTAMRTHAARLYWQWFRGAAALESGAQPWNMFLKSVPIESFVQIEIEVVNTQSAAWAIPNRMMAGDVEDVNQSLRIRRRLAACLSQLLAPIESRSMIVGKQANPCPAESNTVTSPADGSAVLDDSGAARSDPLAASDETLQLSIESLEAPPAALAASMREVAIERFIYERGPKPQRQDENTRASIARPRVSEAGSGMESCTRPCHETVGARLSDLQPIADVQAVAEQAVHQPAKHRQLRASEFEAEITSLTLPRIAMESAPQDWGHVGDVEPASSQVSDAAAEEIVSEARPCARNLQELQHALMSMGVGRDLARTEETENSQRGQYDEGVQRLSQSQMAITTSKVIQQSNEPRLAALIDASEHDSTTMNTKIDDSLVAKGDIPNESSSWDGIIDVAKTRVASVVNPSTRAASSGNKDSAGQENETESLSNNETKAPAPSEEAHSDRTCEHHDTPCVADGRRAERIFRSQKASKGISGDDSCSDECHGMLSRLSSDRTPVRRKRCNAVPPEGDENVHPTQLVRITRSRSTKPMPPDAIIPAASTALENPRKNDAIETPIATSGKRPRQTESPATSKHSTDATRLPVSAACLDSSVPKHVRSQHRAACRHAASDTASSGSPSNPASGAKKSRTEGDPLPPSPSKTNRKEVELGQVSNTDCNPISMNGMISLGDAVDGERALAKQQFTRNKSPGARAVCVEPLPLKTQVTEATCSPKHRATRDKTARLRQRETKGVQSKSIARGGPRSLPRIARRCSSRTKRIYLVSSEETSGLEHPPTSDSAKMEHIQTDARPEQVEDDTLSKNSSASSINGAESAQGDAAKPSADQPDTSTETLSSQDSLPPWARYLRNLGQWRFFTKRAWPTKQ
jgi:hypothetical protein